MATTITSIAIAGTITKLWDHTQKLEPLNFADSAPFMWREASGTVNMMLSSIESYRLRGSSPLSLSFDGIKIYSAATQGTNPTESAYDYFPFLCQPYTLDDGVTWYTLCHMEWYAAALNGGTPSSLGWYNSWVTSVVMLTSTDGGATWAKHTVTGNHVVAKPGAVWTGSVALSSHAYEHANLFTGLQQITKLLREGSYYYAMGNLYQRDFSVIDPGAGLWDAPLVKEGWVWIRTTDPTNPNGWEHWVSGSTWEAMALDNWGVYYPTYQSVVQTAWGPTWYYDTIAQLYVVIFVPPATVHEPILYTTSPSLATPVWSPPMAIVGSATLETDPLGKPGDPAPPWLGFTSSSYPLIIDPNTPTADRSFENVATMDPWLFYCQQPGLYNNRGPNLENKNDVYRVPLHTEYADDAAPVADFRADQVPGTLTVQLQDLSV